MQGLGLTCRHRVPVSMQTAARLPLAERNFPLDSANQSRSVRMRPTNMHTFQVSPSIRCCTQQISSSIDSQKVVSRNAQISSSMDSQKAVSRSAQEEQFEGLMWFPDFESVPKWTIEPDLDAIKQVASETLASKEIRVTFLTQGLLTKVYNVRKGADDFMMYVSMPVEPWCRTTLSRVATVEWIHRNTQLPVPRILAFDASLENAIGFEWILMTNLPGKPLDEDSWSKMPFLAKKNLVQEMAKFSSCSFKKQLRGIGNIYAGSTFRRYHGEVDTGVNLPEVEVKRLMSISLFWLSRFALVARGPFRCSKDWVMAAYSCKERVCHSILSNCNKKEAIASDELASGTLENVQEAKLLVGDIFPSGNAEPEPSMIFLTLNLEDLLVDDAGALTGVLGWDCVSALPLWMACYYPHILQANSRTAKPNREDYHPDDGGEYLYQIHMEEHELTILRQYFLDEMQRLEPGWIKVFQASKRKRLFMDLGLQVVAA